MIVEMFIFGLLLIIVGIIFLINYKKLANLNTVWGVGFQRNAVRFLGIILLLAGVYLFFSGFNWNL